MSSNGLSRSAAIVTGAVAVLAGVSACGTADSEPDRRPGVVSTNAGSVVAMVEAWKPTERFGITGTAPETVTATCQGSGPSLKVDVALPEGVSVRADAATKAITLTVPGLAPVTVPAEPKGLTVGVNGIAFDRRTGADVQRDGQEGLSKAGVRLAMAVECGPLQ